MDITEFIQLVSVLYLSGLIWTIQLVQYPSFRYINEQEFSQFHQHHYKRISIVVAPAMMVELISGIYLLFREPSYGGKIHLLLLGILFIIWLSTFLIQVPIHRRLEKGKNMQEINALVKTNWIRTIGWTSRAVVLCVIYLAKY